MKVKLLNLIPDQDNEFMRIHVVKVPAQGTTDNQITRSGKGKTVYEKTRDRELFRRRASTEPITGHVKQDHLMLRNFLKGVEGDMINTLLAGAVFNMMKMLRRIHESIISILNELLDKLVREYQILIKYC